MGDVDDCLSLVATRVPGLRAILVTDRDGITVMRHPKEDETEQRLSSNVEAAFSIAADQVSALIAPLYYQAFCKRIAAWLFCCVPGVKFFCLMRIERQQKEECVVRRIGGSR